MIANALAPVWPKEEANLSYSYPTAIPTAAATALFTSAARACVRQVAGLAPQHLSRMLVVQPRPLEAPVPRLRLCVSAVSVLASVTGGSRCTRCPCRRQLRVSVSASDVSVLAVSVVMGVCR